MKKLLIILALVLLAAVGANAAPGDAVGEIYSTDILAYVNGSPIDSYNIGGQTVILAEDLCNNDTGIHYGFDCVYDNSTRTLTLTSLFNKGNADITVSRGKVGEIVGTVYETDIKVIFNSHEVKGYNIGGQTAICIEDLGAHAKNEPNVAYGYSKYLCNAVWNGDSREIMLNTYLQDTNYFGNYPKRKLDIKIKDNVISCSFDQLNPYSGNVSYEFSDEFKSTLWKISPVYFDNTVVGQVVMLPGGMAAFKMNNFEMHRKTSELEKVLSYGESVQYINDNFEVVSKKETSDATVFLAKKDGVHYLMFAMANGGLVCDSKYDSSYSLIEFIMSDAGELCLNLKSEAFSGIMPVSTSGYDFSSNPESYVSGALADNERITSRSGLTIFTIDDTPHLVDSVCSAGTIYVNAAAVCEITKADYMVYGGILYISAPRTSHTITTQFDSESAKVPEYIGIMSENQAYVNGNLVTSKNNFYYCNGQIYVPAEFFVNIYR